MEEKTLRAMLRFGVDDQAASEAGRKVRTLGNLFSELEKQAAEAQREMVIRKEAGQSVDILAQKLERLDEQMKAVSREAKEIVNQDFISNINKLREGADRLGGLSSIIAVIGGTIAGPLTGAMAKYVSGVGKSEEAGRKWAGSLKRIEDSTERVGRVVTTAVLPVMEQLARVSEQAAKFAERNPQAVQAALGIGGGLVTLGTIGILASQGIRMYADVQFLSAAALQNVAADKMIAAAGVQAGAAGKGAAGAIGAGAFSMAGLTSAVATVAPAAIAIAGPAIGAAVYDYLARNFGLGGGANVGMFVSVIANNVGKLSDALGITTNAANDWFVSVSRLTQATDAQTQAALDAAMRGSTTPTYNGIMAFDPEGRIAAREAEYKRLRESQSKALPLFVAYRRAEEQAERDYHDKRLRMIADFAKQQQDIEGQLYRRQDEERKAFLAQQAKGQTHFDKEQTKAALEFAEQRTTAEAEYYKQREKAAGDFDADTLEREYQHRRNLAKIDEESDLRIEELAANVDALGIVRELRARERARRDAEENFKDGERQRNTAYAQQVKDLEQNFAETRAVQLAEFAKQQQERRTEFEQERALARVEFAQRQEDEREKARQESARRAQDFDSKMLEYDQQYSIEQARRLRDFRERLIELDAALTGEQEKRKQFYEETAKDFDAWLTALRSGTAYSPTTTSAGGSTARTLTPTSGGRVIPAMAGGGYASYGAYVLGDAPGGGAGGREFVMNAATTSAAERLAGRSLSQDTILNAMRGYSVNVGGIAAYALNPQAAIEQAVQAVYNGLTQAFAGAKVDYGRI